MREAEAGFEDLEARLAGALAWQMPARSIARLDSAVASFGSGRGERRWRRLVLVLAVAVALMGAAITLSLVQQAASLIPGHLVAYQRGTIIDQSRAVDGYNVKLERAWLDPNQLVLAFSIPETGLAGPVVPRANVVDSEGRHYLEFAGGDITEETAGSGSVLAFDVPPGVTGRVHLTVSVPYLMTLRTNPPDVTPEQPLTYEFDLWVQPARTIDVDRSSEVGGRAVSLRWLRFSPTAVRIRLDADLSGLLTGDHPTWFLDTSIRRPDGSTERLTWAALPPEWTGQSKAALKDALDRMNGSVTTFQSMAGTDDPVGTWTVTVDRIVPCCGNDTAPIDGPWVFEVQVP